MAQINEAAKAALDAIKKTVAFQSRAIYCFHAWMDFNNLGMSGYRFPSVQSDTVPRMSLIPLVVMKDRHIESRVDTNSPNLNSIPSVFEYQRTIEESYSDMLKKFGKFGFRRINALTGDIQNAERVLEIFDKVFGPFYGKGKLQDLPEYLSAESQFRTVLSAPSKRRIDTTAVAELDKLVKTGGVTEAEYHMWLSALPEFAESALIAHRTALTPGENGILTRSIIEINAGDKNSFDPTDNFLITEFPGYDSTTKQTVKASEQDGLVKLADLLADRLGSAPSTPPAEGSAPPLVPPAGTSTEEVVSLEEPDEEEEEETTEETTKVPGDTDGDGLSEESLTSVRCEAMTKADTQCKNDATHEHVAQGIPACMSPAHFKQLSEKA